MESKRRIKAAKGKLPETLDDVIILIREIGDGQAAIKRIEDEANRKIQSVKDVARAQVRGLEATMTEKFEEVFAFAGTRRSELLKGKKKKLELISGEMGWRFSPLSIVVEDEDGGVAFLKHLGLGETIKTKETIDKSALKKLLKKDDELKQDIEGHGVTVKDREECFFVSPEGVKLTLEIDPSGRVKKTAS